MENLKDNNLKGLNRRKVKKKTDEGCQEASYCIRILQDSDSLPALLQLL